jgi:hypothetical protein
MSNPTPVQQPSKTARKRLYPVIRHNLYEIDLERRTAFCTACGRTEIHVAKSRTNQTPKVICINRLREIYQANRDQRRLQSGWKPRHSLSQLDTETMTAICAVCGRTDIQKNTRNGSTYYICATKVRPYTRKYRRTHYSSRISSPLVHVLSQIDEENKTAVCSRCGPVQIYVWQGKRKIGRRCSNASVRNGSPAQKIRREVNTNLINRYKVDHGCKHCGFNASLIGLALYSGNPNKKDPNIEKLLNLSSERLMQELEKCEVHCIDCRSLVNDE